MGDDRQTTKLHRKYKGKQRLMKIVRLLQPLLRINFKPRWKLQIQQLEETHPNNTWRDLTSCLFSHLRIGSRCRLKVKVPQLTINSRSRLLRI
jgi:hypothetical protein